MDADNLFHRINPYFHEDVSRTVDIKRLYHACRDRMNVDQCC